MSNRTDREIQGLLLWLYSLPIYLFDRYIVGPVLDILKRGRRDT